MRRNPALFACAAAMICSTAAAQNFHPRSLDYLFAATANDARAIWVNPAGLAALPEASILAEVLVQRKPDASTRVSQLTLGFNSQGLSFGYNRERLVTDSSNHTYRLAFARGLSRWSIGLAVSHYRAGNSSVGFDLGVQYLLAGPIRIGLALRNMREPQLRLDTLPVTGVASAGIAIIPGTLVLAAESIVERRINETGYDVRYRGGARFGFARRFPIGGFGSAQLDHELGVMRWTFGISIGGSRRGIVVAGLVPGDPSRVETISFTGLATNDLVASGR